MCISCKKLLPLATTGDGNCLLHAASLGELNYSIFNIPSDHNIHHNFISAAFGIKPGVKQLCVSVSQLSNNDVSSASQLLNP